MWLDQRPWGGKGSALSAQGKYDEAIQAYDEAISLNSSNPVNWYNKGNAFGALGKTIEANAA
jgi:tetratricopeptide (TPR) repeat protein